jgi:hypothetical protein
LDYTQAGLYGLLLDPDLETSLWVYLEYTIVGAQPSNAAE